MYVYTNTAARSRNVYTFSAIITAWCLFARTELLWWFRVADNNKTYLSLHIMCPIFLSDCNQIWILWQIWMSLQHKFSWKSVPSKPSWYKGIDWQAGGRTDGQDDAKRRSSYYANTCKNSEVWNYHNPQSNKIIIIYYIWSTPFNEAVFRNTLKCFTKITVNIPQQLWTKSVSFRAVTSGLDITN